MYNLNRKAVNTFKAEATAGIAGLPPAFIEGFRPVLLKNYTVQIGAGVTSVQGSQVTMKQQILSRNNWQSPYTGGDVGFTYYVYLTRGGEYKVDFTKPAYDNIYYYYAHPVYGWRVIEKLWIDSDDKIKFVSKNYTDKQSTVVVAAKDYVGDADYYCDGTNDEFFITAAMAYVSGSIAEEVKLTTGTFVLDGPVTPTNNVKISGSGQNTIVTNSANYSFLDDSSTNTLENFFLSDMLMKMRIEYYAGNVDGFTIQNVKFAEFGSYDPYIKLSGCRDTLISSCTGAFYVELYNGALTASCVVSNNISNLSATRFLYALDVRTCSVTGNILDSFINGIKVEGINYVTISSNVITSSAYYEHTGIGIEVYDTISGMVSANSITGYRSCGILIGDALTDILKVSVASNKISESGLVLPADGYGGCAIYINLLSLYISTTANQAFTDGSIVEADTGYSFHETGRTLSNCTFATSGTVLFEQDSFDITKTVAAGTEAVAAIADNTNTTDMHSFTAGTTYTFGGYFDNSTKTVADDEAFIGITQYYESEWHATEYSYADGTDLDGTHIAVFAEVEIDAAATGCYMYVRLSSTASDGETIRVGELYASPQNYTNSFDNQYLDFGTANVSNGNTWQTTDIAPDILTGEGVVKSGASTSQYDLGDEAPTGSKRYEFESSYADQDGTDPWDTKTSVKFTTESKFGFYALTANTTNGVITDADADGIALDTDFSFGAWVYANPLPTAKTEIFKLFTARSSIDSHLYGYPMYITGVTYDTVNGNLISFNPIYGTIEIHSGITSTIGSSFAASSVFVGGLAYDSDNQNLITGDNNSNLIYIHSGVTSTVSSSFATPASDISSITYDSGSGNLISCDSVTGLIYIHSGITSTVSSSFSAPGLAPFGLAYNPNTGNLISADRTTKKLYIHNGITSEIIESIDVSDGYDLYDVTYDTDDNYLIYSTISGPYSYFYIIDDDIVNIMVSHDGSSNLELSWNSGANGESSSSHGISTGWSWFSVHFDTSADTIQLVVNNNVEAALDVSADTALTHGFSFNAYLPSTSYKIDDLLVMPATLLTTTQSTDHYFLGYPWAKYDISTDLYLVAKSGGYITALSPIKADYGIAIPTMIVEDQKPSGTSGGSFTAGAWQTRTLNTEVYNNITGASLSSNQITLPAGTYDISFEAPTYSVDQHQARFYNITDSSESITGTSRISYVSSLGRSIITIASQKVFELQHRCRTTNSASTGYGYASGIYFTVEHETYSRVVIRQIE